MSITTSRRGSSEQTARLAFTAIEALAATTLASLMLVAVLGVLGTISRGQKVLLAQSEGHASWHGQLTHQLQWDLENSRSMFVGANQLVLEGFAGRDFASGRPTGRPTRVEYFLDPTNTAGVLLRRESHLDLLTTTNWRAEVVCVGAEVFVIGQSGAVPNAQQQFGNDQFQPIPDQITVSLVMGKASKNTNGRSFGQTFILR